MNLEKIRTDYPKGYKILNEWFFSKYQFDLDNLTRLPDYRVQYDFFDGLGIIMEVLYYKKPTKQFGYIVTHVWDYFQGGTNTRTEAEEAGFMKCFEILESRENE